VQFPQVNALSTAALSALTQHGCPAGSDWSAVVRSRRAVLERTAPQVTVHCALAALASGRSCARIPPRKIVARLSRVSWSSSSMASCSQWLTRTARDRHEPEPAFSASWAERDPSLWRLADGSSPDLKEILRRCLPEGGPALDRGDLLGWRRCHTAGARSADPGITACRRQRLRPRLRRGNDRARHTDEIGDHPRGPLRDRGRGRAQRVSAARHKPH